ncbi:expressed protein [Chlorella variabilis]|uniref:Expressed protein n=1 Tax=Chlorella variabilis TaxID=554065 RepID=E1ZCS8_CHLVA|nr:expressed protein [Chlorella variabilis]EFN56099.1 expressed protein [Chlorella variabilis]|eukprot:XP_005848201.1 expressed protein [Chlorella variabilis]
MSAWHCATLALPLPVCLAAIHAARLGGSPGTATGEYASPWLRRCRRIGVWPGLDRRSHRFKHAPAAILAVLDARPPGHTAARWVALPHVSVVAHGCASHALTLGWTRHAGWAGQRGAGSGCRLGACRVGCRCGPRRCRSAARTVVRQLADARLLAAHRPVRAGRPGLSLCLGLVPVFLLWQPGTAAGISEGGSRGGRGPNGRSAAPVLHLYDEKADGVRAGVAPSKRQNLAVLLGKQFRAAAGKAELADGHGLFVGHTRFATSSIPLPSESHPHQWAAPSPAVVRRSDASTPGGISSGTEQFGVFITHNGDNDFARDVEGRYRTHHETSVFLAALLGSPPHAKCSSINMAGMMELHRTEGMWEASLRLALVEVADVSFERVAAAALGGIRGDREVPDLAAFVWAGRVVALADNPYVSFSSINLTPGFDSVAADLADVTRVLHAITRDWSNPASLNRRSGAAFTAARQRIGRERRAEGRGAGNDTDGQDIDVLLVGVVGSLWLAKQFAADLKTLFLGLRVAAISANKVIGVLGGNRGRVPATGFPFCRSSAKLAAAIALAISHSGQTIPTIHAVRLLNAMMPGRVFAMRRHRHEDGAGAGPAAVPRRPLLKRCFDTKAGWRSAEPASISVVALAHSLTELLLLTGATLVGGIGEGRGKDRPPVGLALNAEELLDLRVERNAFVTVRWGAQEFQWQAQGRGVVEGAARRSALTGFDAAGGPVDSPHHGSLVQAGRRWALHILEGPWSWALAAAYIAGTVISGYPVVHAIVDAITAAADAAPEVRTASSHAALVFDSMIYIWCGILAACLLRLVQRRPLLARWGKRTLVVADVPYVSQCVEAFVSKRFALSYGIASIEVHAANPADHLVHKFTHRVARGVLIAFGRPDGRLYSQTTTEAWIQLGLLQAKVIASLGARPEVLTLGHNAFTNEYIDRHLVLPTTRPKVLAELLQSLDDEQGTNPNALYAARRHVLAGTVLADGAVKAIKAHRQSTFKCAASAVGTGAASPADASPAATRPPAARGSQDQAGNGAPMASGGRGPPSSADSEEAAEGNLTRVLTLKDLADTPLGALGSRKAFSSGGTGELARGDSVLALGVEAHVMGEHRLHAGSRKDAVEGAWQRMSKLAKHREALMADGDADATRAAMGAMASGMNQMLDDQRPAPACDSCCLRLPGWLAQGVIEALLESRFLSLERLIAFFVMFHAMAAAWPLNLDISRSQSGLRIATTAAPVTASDIEFTLAEAQAERLMRGASSRHAAVAARWRGAAERGVRLRKINRL